MVVALMFDLNESVITLAASIIASVLAVLSILEILSRGAQRTRERFLAWRRRRRIRGLVISPTIDEIAKYSTKIPQREEPEEHIEKRRKKALERLASEKLQERSISRLYVLAFLFTICFGMLAVMFSRLALDF